MICFSIAVSNNAVDHRQLKVISALSMQYLIQLNNWDSLADKYEIIYGHLC